MIQAPTLIETLIESLIDPFKGPLKKGDPNLENYP